jgi:hypothetical protein
MSKTLFIFPTLMIFLLSCTPSSSDEGYPVLKASLEETNTSLYDIFEKIEIIPLETTDSSLLKGIQKIKYFDNKYYVFDGSMSRILFFDNKGKYINKIDAKGNGPGEYENIINFNLKETSRQIEIIATFDIFNYDLNASFINKFALPTSNWRHRSMEHLDEKNYVLYRSAAPGEPVLQIVSKDESKEVKDLYIETFYLNSLRTAEIFSRDEQGNLYFTLPFLNEVYRITPDSLEIAYTWDFGSKTNDISKLKSAHIGDTDYNIVEQEALGHLRMFRNESHPNIFYSFAGQFQTASYYYAFLTFGPRDSKPKHLFYKKKTGEYILFEKTSEGVDIGRPLLVTNDYMITELDYEKKEAFAKILTGENKEIIDNSNEDDNSFLIKYAFKK